jgi:proline iminopeptidase
MLDVGDGNHVYWEQCGNPDGKPAVVLHGGPGSGCTPQHRRWFDPAVYRIVLLDQRNCVRSTPLGGSFGSMLGLAYAQRHPARVSGLVLCAVATGRQAEVDLLTRGLGPLFPEAWARFRDGAGDADIVAGHARRLGSASEEERAAAARDWCAWEDAITPTVGPSPRFAEPAFRLAFA